MAHLDLVMARPDVALALLGIVWTQSDKGLTQLDIHMVGGKA